MALKEITSAVLTSSAWTMAFLGCPDLAHPLAQRSGMSQEQWRKIAVLGLEMRATINWTDWRDLADEHLKEAEFVRHLPFPEESEPTQL